VSRLAALEACPHVPPHVHSVLVQPLEPPRQERSSSPSTSNSSSGIDIKEEKRTSWWMG
jgi:hypothetical protein